MPAWAGKWKGGRFYLDDAGRKVFFIERRKRAIKLKTHDEDLAVGELARFLEDPEAYVRPAPVPVEASAVHITKERLTLYMESIHDCAEDHRKARRSDLFAWAQYRDELGRPLDLRTADRKTLRAALASFRGDTKDKRRTGGYARRAEALNAFARFLIEDRDHGLTTWAPLKIAPSQAPAQTRAERQYYTLEQLEETFRRLGSQPMRDLFLVRVATGLHHTEIEQLEGCPVMRGPLPDKSAVAVRELAGDHEIRGVLQVVQKTKPRHRVSVTGPVLAAALRLREHVPNRMDAWEEFAPLTPSNLRHTFITLAGEVGEWVTYTGAGVDLDRIAQVAGHRAGSKMTGSRYDKLQVPPMIRLPLGWAA